MTHAVLRSLPLLALVAACRSGNEPIAPEPEPPTAPPLALACAAPAPLNGTPAWTDPRFIVTYHDGTDPATETARLSTKYGFTPRFVYRYALLGFAADLTQPALAGVRCEATVRRVSTDHWTRVIP